MAEVIEKHEDEGAKAFDPHLTWRLLKYLRPYRWRASFSVFLVILSSLFEIAGPAITAIAIDLFVKPIKLDDADWKILGLLQTDGRATYARLAEAAGISTASRRSACSSAPASAQAPEQAAAWLGVFGRRGRLRLRHCGLRLGLHLLRDGVEVTVHEQRRQSAGQRVQPRLQQDHVRAGITDTDCLGHFTSPGDSRRL